VEGFSSRCRQVYGSIASILPQRVGDRSDVHRPGVEQTATDPIAQFKGNGKQLTNHHVMFGVGVGSGANSDNGGLGPSPRFGTATALVASHYSLFHVELPVIW